MTLHVDTSSIDFKKFKTLNEDVKLKRTSDVSQHYDLQMENGDYVNVTGIKSLDNAICIAIMTRFNELDYIELYDGFGCRVHELIKANKSEMVRYKIELFTEEVLKKIRRIDSIDEVTVKEDDIHNYLIEYTVTSISDETITGSVTI